MKVLLIVPFSLFTGLLCLSRWIKCAFGKVTLFQILMHIGESPEVLTSYQLLSFFGFVLLWLVITAAIWAGVTVAMKSRLLRKRARWLYVTGAIIVVGYGALVWRHLDKKFMIAYELRCRRETSTFLSDNCRSVGPEDIRFAEGKRNLVVLLVESADECFAAAGWLPRLSALRKENLSFAGQRQVSCTECTIMAETAVLFGLLRVPWNGNFAKWNAVHPPFRAPSIFRMLIDSGYEAAYVQGGNMAFASTEGLFAATPEVRIFEQYGLVRQYGSSAVMSKFGVSDKYVLAKCREEIERMAGTGRPFVLVGVTVDTHGNGAEYLEPDAIRYSGEFAQDCWRNCDDRIAEFIRWIRSSPFADNTVIVVLGDHLRHGKQSAKVPPRGESVFNLVIRPRCGAERLSRHFATFDWAPTLVELAGGTLRDGKMGLGTSLLHANAKTLLEEVGQEVLESEMRKPCCAYRDFMYSGHW